jgi:hypothetical protein
MRIDETHRPWARFTLATLLIAIAVYVPYGLLSSKGPSGGSAIGLTYGIVGFAMMIFAGLLSMRKKFPVIRIGRAKVWMRGHLWLGFLSYPIILLHSAFGLGGPLTTALMVLFTIVFISGIAGAVLQHYLPIKMTREVPMETIYDQIDSVTGQLCQEADDIMVQLIPAMEAVPAAEVVGARTLPLYAAAREVESKDLQPIRTLYAEKVQPYLLKPGYFSHELADPETSATIFEQIRKMSPTIIDEFVNDLENICTEKRQLDRQARLHRWLHAWLFIHLPISWALLILGAVHAVIALRY